MKGKKIIITALMSLLLVISLTIGAFYRQHNVAEATFNPNMCIRFGDYTKKTEIPKATILVGTYLISTPALTDKVLEKALQSAKDSSQPNSWYKSELGSGRWYDVTIVKDLTSITEGSESVDEYSLNDWYIRYYIDSNGVVHDLLLESIDATLFNDPFPYSKWYMDEYKELADLVNNGTLTSDTYEQKVFDYYVAVVKHMNYENTDSYTEERDTEISNLTIVQNQLKNSKEKDDSRYGEGMDDVIESIDAARRARFIKNDLNDMTELNGIEGLIDFSVKREENGSPDDVDSDTDEIVRSTRTKLTTSVKNYEAKVVSEPGDDATRLEIAKYLYFSDIVSEGANKTLSDTIRKNLRSYLAVENIETSNDEFTETELQIIGELLPLSIEDYQQVLSEGVSAQYETAYIQGSEAAALTEILLSQQKNANRYQMALRKLIEANNLRVSDLEAVQLIAAKLLEALDMYDVIRQDDEFTDYADAELTDYVIYLSTLLDSYIDGSEFDDEDDSDYDTSDEMEELEDRIKEAQLRNDQNEVENLTMIKDALADSQGKKSGNSADMNAGIQSAVKKLTDQLLARAKSDLGDGNSKSGALAILLAMGDGDSLAALMDENGLDDSLMEGLLNAANMVSNATTGVKNTGAVIDRSGRNRSAGDGSGDGSGGAGNGLNGDGDTSDGSGDGSGGDSSWGSKNTSSSLSNMNMSSQVSDFLGDLLDENSGDDGKNKLNRFAGALGKTRDGLDDTDKAAILAVGLGLDLGQGNGDDLDKLGKDGRNKLSDAERNRLLMELMGSGLIYDTLIDEEDTVFVSLKAMEKAAGYRYVFNYEKNEADMQKTGADKSSHYEIFEDSKIIIDHKGVENLLTKKSILFHKWLYIDQASSQKYFSVTGVPIPGTDYSLALNPEAYAKYIDIINTLIEAEE